LANPIFVDPEISRAKFEREMNQWQDLAPEHGKRGIFVTQAKFPDLFAVFAAPRLRPPSVVFGVALNFDNYDFWPPSVRFLDPFTREPYTKTNLPPFLMKQPLPAGFQAPPGVQVQEPVAQAVMFQGDEGEAFFCAQGIREYHDHPAHTGDPWLMHRKSGKGTLFHVLDKLHEFGISILKAHQMNMVIQVNGYQVEL
jgi:hypothetical protein